jgi:hypothetical protein
MHRALRLPLVFCLAVLAVLAAAQPDATPATRETVLFPFDDHALPFNKGLILTLMPGRKSATKPDLGADPEHLGKPVLNIGKPGDPDEKRIYFMGTVLKVGGEYRMWYSAHDGSRRRIAYATSKDGFIWEKPKLGLVEYKKGTENNLVALDGDQPMPGMSALVVHDPGDPDPARRFKMIREASSTDLRSAVSADGIRWTSLNGDKDILKHTAMEPSGLTRFNGAYYLNGHGGPVPHPIPMRGYMRAQKRMSVTLVSHDFENWTDAGHVSFRRDPLPPRAVPDFEFHRGEQVHLGAGLWNRGNVILGFYGQWHNATNDRRDCTVDLGLIVSGDGLHFREPLPDFKIVPSFEEPDRAEQRLTQGQGFENIGNRTIVYYGIWPETDRNGPTGVRIATWPRDRLGYFQPAPDTEGAHCISAPLANVRPGARVLLNATHLAPDSQLTVEILDEQFRPLPGYAAADFVALTNKSGLRFPVAWRGRETLGAFDHLVRVRVNWTGAKADAARLYAVYVE